MEIIDQGQFRSLFFKNQVVQSRLSRVEPARLILRYTQYMMGISLLALPHPRKVLLIGVGAGAIIHFLHKHFPETTIDGVDSCTEILDLARSYFSLPISDNIRLHCRDGTDYLLGAKKESYDLILVDAFNDQGMATSIYSDPFFKQAKRCICNDGVICCNLWSGERKKLEKVKKAIRKNTESAIYLPVRDRENIIGLLFQRAVPWESICPSQTTLQKLSARYSMNFDRISTSARTNNMKLAEKLHHWLH